MHDVAEVVPVLHRDGAVETELMQHVLEVLAVQVLADEGVQFKPRTKELLRKGPLQLLEGRIGFRYRQEMLVARRHA